MAQRIDPPEGPALVFHFRGGPEDGKSLRSDQPADAYGSACALWAITRKGTTGRRFKWPSADGKIYCYKVVQRREAQDAITIFCEHVAGG